MTNSTSSDDSLKNLTTDTSGPVKSRGNDTLVYVISFLMDATIVFFMLGLNFRAVDVGASPSQLGMLGASFAVSYSLLCYFLARWLSSLDARVSSAVSSFFLLILCIVGAMAKSLTMFVILGVLFGVVTAFFWSPLEHFMGRGKSLEGLYRTLSRFNIWWCSGFAAATAVCGTLYQANFRLPFLVGAAALVPVIVAALFLSPDNSVPHAEPAPAAASNHNAAIEKKRFFLTTARIFIFLTYFSAGCIFALFPKLGDSLHLDKPLVSLILFSLYVGQLLSFYLLGRSRSWHSSAPFLLVGQIFISVAFLAVFLFDSTVVFAGAFAIIGVVSGLSYFSSLFYTLHEPVFESSLAGVHESLLASGRLVGPLLCGQIAAAFTLKTPYLFLACVFALFTVYTFVLSRRLR